VRISWVNLQHVARGEGFNAAAEGKTQAGSQAEDYIVFIAGVRRESMSPGG
jgi:hypothetical protein